jgi:xanthine dehydrogenase small subunit
MNDMNVKFFLNGQLTVVENPHATLTVLDYLREDRQLCGTKEGCAGGDCGACVVGVISLNRAGGNVDCIQYSTSNSCIRFVGSLNGCAVITIEGLEKKSPVQDAMVACHASQCGFCTPGFVMSLAMADMRQRASNGKPLDRSQIGEAISGNLCRCTGYRPIIDAGLLLADAPKTALSAADWMALLKPIQKDTSLNEFLGLRAKYPNAVVVGGGTDVGLWVNKQHQTFDHVLNTSQVAELKIIQPVDGRLSIGAAASLEAAFAALSLWCSGPNRDENTDENRDENKSVIDEFSHRFAGQPIRQTGTMGGNVANGSPIGDAMPLLIALNASVRLQSMRGAREMALETFYLDYKKTALAPDEIVTHILVPPFTGRLFAYKVSKRFEDDISAVCLILAIHLTLKAEQSVVGQARIGVGGMAAVPKRALKTETALLGQPVAIATFENASDVLRHEFTPLTDMRASANYRRQVISNLLKKVYVQLLKLETSSVLDLNS